MKSILFLSLLTLTGLQVACDKTNDATIQREEAYEREDNFNRTVPVESDEEVNIDRDVIGDDEVEVEN